MSAPLDFDPASGTLVADEPTVARLRVADPTLLLAAAGVLDDDGGVPPALRAALDALAATDAPGAGALTLTAKGRSAHARLTAAVAVLRMPPGDDSRRTIVHVPPSLLPDALARAVDLGPRPASGRAPSDTGRLAAADHEVSRWWTLHARGSGDRSGEETLEVVDTAEGYWLVDRPGGGADAPDTLAPVHAVRAGEVWRRIVRLVAHALPEA